LVLVFAICATGGADDNSTKSVAHFGPPILIDNNGKIIGTNIQICLETKTRQTALGTFTTESPRWCNLVCLCNSFQYTATPPLEGQLTIDVRGCSKSGELTIVKRIKVPVSPLVTSLMTVFEIDISSIEFIDNINRQLTVGNDGEIKMTTSVQNGINVNGVPVVQVQVYAISDDQYNDIEEGSYTFNVPVFFKCNGTKHSLTDPGSINCTFGTNTTKVTDPNKWYEALVPVITAWLQARNLQNFISSGLDILRKLMQITVPFLNSNFFLHILPWNMKVLETVTESAKSYMQMAIPSLG